MTHAMVILASDGEPKSLPKFIEPMALRKCLKVPVEVYYKTNAVKGKESFNEYDQRMENSVEKVVKYIKDHKRGGLLLC